MKFEEFSQLLKNINITLSKEQYNKLEIYKNLLIEWNKKFNLTAIIKPKEIYLKHFLDSLYLNKTGLLTKSNNLCDIGTGAGFPGIVLAIFYPNLEIILVESNIKKCNFLKIVKENLNLENIKIVNERAEKLAKTMREHYDLITSRAVSNLQILSEISIPLIKEDGFFLPMKSHVDEELQNSKEIIKNTGAKFIDKVVYDLPIENSNRSIPIIKKIKKTPNKYPRNYEKIVKSVIKR